MWWSADIQVFGDVFVSSLLLGCFVVYCITCLLQNGTIPVKRVQKRPIHNQALSFQSVCNMLDIEAGVL